MTEAKYLGGGNMKKLAGTIFAHVLSLVGILRLFFSLSANERSQLSWQLGVTTVCVIILVVTVFEIIDFIRTKPTQFRVLKQKRIKAYMRKWLGSGGRAFIFTRDMTWANDPAVQKTLHEKAQRDELTICIEHMIPLAEQLRDNGAKVISYGELGVVPRSRFTVIDFESNSARVAVGGAVGSAHVIQEFRNGDPFFAVAEDLARLLVAYGQHENVAPR
jgi:hypothetical protein